jgi:hypothetical protein
MTSNSARARPRHQAPSRGCHLEREKKVITVAQLLDRHQHQPSQHRPLWCRLVQYRPQYAPPPRRITMKPPPAPPQDQLLRGTVRSTV